MLAFERRLTLSSGLGLLVALCCFAGCGGSATTGGNAGATASAGSAGATASAGSAGANAGSGAGGASAGPACSSITTEAACTARRDCHAISERILCPGSGAPCPFQFKYCSDSDCGPACSATQICVGSQVVGGPAGNPPSDPTYACQPKPAACGATIDCACAGAACSATYQCQSSSGRQILCVLEAR